MNELLKDEYFEDESLRFATDEEFEEILDEYFEKVQERIKEGIKQDEEENKAMYEELENAATDDELTKIFEKYDAFKLFLDDDK